MASIKSEKTDTVQMLSGKDRGKRSGRIGRTCNLAPNHDIVGAVPDSFRWSRNPLLISRRDAPRPRERRESARQTSDKP